MGILELDFRGDMWKKISRLARTCSYIQTFLRQDSKNSI